MQNVRTHPTVAVLARWSWLLVVFLLVACAAPAPPRANFQSMDSVPIPQVFIADPNAPPESLSDALSQVDGSYGSGFDNLDGALQMYKLGNSLNESEGGLRLTGENTAPPQLLADVFLTLAVTSAPFACIQSEDQAYFVVRLSALEAFASSSPNPGTGPDDCSQILGSLGIDEQCEDCGCIGPMGGNPASCPTTGMQTWNLQATWE